MKPVCSFLQEFINFTLHYVADLSIPIKRYGTRLSVAMQAGGGGYVSSGAPSPRCQASQWGPRREAAPEGVGGWPLHCVRLHCGVPGQWPCTRDLVGATCQLPKASRQSARIVLCCGLQGHVHRVPNGYAQRVAHRTQLQPRGEGRVRALRQGTTQPSRPVSPASVATRGSSFLRASIAGCRLPSLHLAPDQESRFGCA